MRLTVRGIGLNVQVTGDGPALLLLHGFLGSASTWSKVIDDLSGEHRCIAVDLPGHGLSDAPDDWRRYTMEECIADLSCLLGRLEVASVALLGYSMGGRIAMRLAVDRPELVRVLICESANPGIEDDVARQARLAADERLAASVDAGGMARFVDEWEKLPLFQSQQLLVEADRQLIRRQRLATSPVGAANSLRGLSQGRPAPLWGALAELIIPMLFICGASDDKYCDITARMGQAMSSAEVVTVAGAGHTVHIEQPQEFVAAVIDFLERNDHAA